MALEIERKLFKKLRFITSQRIKNNFTGSAGFLHPGPNLPMTFTGFPIRLRPSCSSYFKSLLRALLARCEEWTHYTHGMAFMALRSWWFIHVSTLWRLICHRCGPCRSTVLVSDVVSPQRERAALHLAIRQPNYMANCIRCQSVTLYVQAQEKRKHTLEMCRELGVQRGFRLACNWSSGKYAWVSYLCYETSLIFLQVEPSGIHVLLCRFLCLPAGYWWMIYELIAVDLVWAVAGASLSGLDKHFKID